MATVPVLAGAAGVDHPFQRRNVSEWSHLDRLTGVLEHARVESDHWAASRAGSTGNYNKVVDCRARNTADGSVQQKQRKQLEVFQAQGPGGSLQVIRTQSITSSSSSKTTGWNRTPAITAPDFENLQLTLNPLNLSSEKTKASVGRSGSLGGRRPPSRPRSLINKVGSTISGEEDHLDDVNLRLSKVSQLCHQIKGEAQKRHSDFFNALEIPPLGVPLHNRNGLNGSVHDDLTIEVSPVIIEQIDDSDSGETETLRRSFPSEEKSLGGLPNGTRHEGVHRKKSSSIEDLHCNDYKDVQKESDNEEDLRRFSKVRRSLQLSPKSSHTIQDLPPIGNVLKIRQELEEKRKFNVPCLKNHEAFENVLKRGEDIINSDVFRGKEFNLLADENKEYITKSACENRTTDDKAYEGFSRRIGNTDSGSPKKRHSFITAESLKVVRERLRRTSSPSTEDTQNADPSVKYPKDNEEQDDGIETEDIPRSSRMDSLSEMEDSPSISRVKSYVYGMESISKSNRSGGRKPPQGTGSLESRTSNRSSSSSGSRTEEWYNRRKSYGFEKVHNTEIVEPPSLAKFKEKNRIESSTDSGICRSTELISLHSLPIKARPSKETTEDMNFKHLRGVINPKTSPSVFVSKMYSNGEDQNFEGRKTFVTLGNESMDSKNDRLVITEPTLRKSVTNHQSDYHHEAHFMNNSQTGAVRGKEFKGVQSLIDNLNTRGNGRLSQAMTISIPIVSEETSHNEDETGDGKKRHAFQHQSEFKTHNTDRPWKKTPVTLNGSETTQNSYNFESNASSWRVRDGWQQQVEPVNEELKRHSIAVDESVYERGGINRHGNTNYVNQPSFEHSFSRVSLSAPFPSSSELIKRRASIGAAASSHPKEQILTSGIRVSFNNNTDSVLDKALECEDDNEESSQQNCMGKKTKRVEFCKTEVHFAAEPGRFNIVETDEKPPPNNMFRRRRRNTPSTLSGQESDPNKSTLPQIRFGDSLYEKTLLSSKETGDDIPTANQISKSEALFNKSVSEIISTKYVHQANFEDVADKEDNIHTESNATITTPSNRTSYFPVCDKDDDNGQHYDAMLTNISEENQPRSILKNNRKSRISHSGEESEMAHISSEGEDARGNSLGAYRGDKGPSQTWRSSLTMQNNKTSDDENMMMIARSDKDVKHHDGESEIKKLLRSLRPTSDKHVGNCILSRVHEDPPNLAHTALDSGVEVKIAAAGPPSYWSVADRIKQVEKKSYSTKVNFGVGEATVVEGMEKTGAAPCRQEEKIKKPTWLSKEERNLDFLDREDSKEEKGLVIRICRQEVSNKEEQAVEKPPAFKSSLMTKISIDVKPSVLSENKRSKFASAKTKSTNITKNICGGKSELLQSPSLIMKTIQKPFTQVQKLSRKFEGLHIIEKIENNQPKGSLHTELVEPISSARQRNSSIVFKECEESTAKTKVSDALDYWRNRVLNTKKKVSLKDIKVCQKPPSPYKNVSSDSDEDVATIRQTREKESFILGELGVSNHLAALKEMYFQSDDDSERADEEVRSIMSGGAEEEVSAEEDGSSIVSGSWSRMRAFRNVRHHFHKFNGTVDKDGPSLIGQQHKVSLATTAVPSYGESSRLRSIETLVSTRSGQPKITSISLKYEGDKGQDRDRYKPDIHKSVRRQDASLQTDSYYSKNHKDSSQVKANISNSGYLTNIYDSQMIKNDSVYVEDHKFDLASKMLENKNPPLHLQSPRSIHVELRVTPDKDIIGSSHRLVAKNTKKLPASEKYQTKLPFQTCESECVKNDVNDHDYEEIKPYSLLENSYLHGKRYVGDSKTYKHYSEEEATVTSPNSLNYSSQSQTATKVFSDSSKSPTSRSLPFYKRVDPSNLNSKECYTYDRNRSLSPQKLSTTKSSPGGVVTENKLKAFHDSSIHSTKTTQRTDEGYQMKNSNNQRHRSDNSKEELRTTKRRSPSQERNESLSALDNLVRSLTPVKSETSQQQYKHLNVSKHAKEVRSKEKETNKMNSNTRNQLITSSMEKLRNHEEQRNLPRSHMKQSKEECNQKNNTMKTEKQIKNDKIDKESNILEELTKAADQILQAVNGYTDEESCKASSTDDDEELGRRKGKRVGQVRKPSACLSTISEAPSSKKKDDTKSSSGVTHSRSNSNVRINQRLSKSRLGPTSSTSSVESFTKEIRRASTAQTRMLLKQERASSLDVRTKGNTTSSSKPTSRTARLLQRASSRELLLQSHGSSSEDLGTGESEIRRQRTHRRARSSIASNKKESTPPLEGRQPARSRREITDTSKTRERSTATSKPSSSARKINSEARNLARSSNSRVAGSKPREGHGTEEERRRSNYGGKGSSRPNAPSKGRKKEAVGVAEKRGSHPTSSSVVLKPTTAPSKSEGTQQLSK